MKDEKVTGVQQGVQQGEQQGVRQGVRQHGAMEFSEPPCDLDAVRRYRVERVREQLRRLDYAGVLLFDPVNCRYACDATNMQIWCTHYETRSVFVAADGPTILFDYGDYPHLAEGISTIDEYRVNSSFYYFTAGPRGEEVARKFGEEIADVVRSYGGGNMRLAVDRLSLRGCEAIMRHGVSIHDGIEVLELARVIKSEGEVALMQASIDVCETALRRMRAKTRVGMTENELWSILHQTNIELGGEWIETRLLSTGDRTFPWFRESSMRKIEAGDMISVDTDLIGPYGYCADMSRSWVCGREEGVMMKPNAKQQRIYEMAYAQIQHNKALLKPGVSFREIGERAFPIPEEFAPYQYVVLMHGVGLADEYPSIKSLGKTHGARYDGVVEENMTICVEAYVGSEASGEGVKLEEQVLVTKDGIRQLTKDSLEEGWL